MDDFSLFTLWRPNCTALLWRATGLSWKSYLFLPFISLLNIVNTTVDVNYMAHYRGDFPWMREVKRTLSRCQEVFLRVTLMLIQSWKKARKKGWDGKGWPLVFFFFFCSLCDARGKRFIPVPQTTSAWLKRPTRWHAAEEMVLHPSSHVSPRDTEEEKKTEKELCVTRFQSHPVLAKYWSTLRTECQGKCLPLFTL